MCRFSIDHRDNDIKDNTGKLSENLVDEGDERKRDIMKRNILNTTSNVA